MLIIPRTEDLRVRVPAAWQVIRAAAVPLPVRATPCGSLVGRVRRAPTGARRSLVPARAVTRQAPSLSGYGVLSLQAKTRIRAARASPDLPTDRAARSGRG